jgi:hypothetical protein
VDSLLPLPLPLAMVICDTIWKDSGSGKATLLGLFSEIGAKEFPATHGNMGVHIALTDAQGTVPVRLQLLDVDEEEEPLYRAETELAFPNPREIINWNIHIRDVVFPAAGEYRLQLFARGEFLMERRLMVKQVGGGHG